MMERREFFKALAASALAAAAPLPVGFPRQWRELTTMDFLSVFDRERQEAYLQHLGEVMAFRQDSIFALMLEGEIKPGSIRHELGYDPTRRKYVATTTALVAVDAAR